MQVAVINYGMGNLRSVLNALAALGAEASLTDEPSAARRAERLILPGVGAFGEGMARLDERGFTTAIPELVGEGRPLLGICLGMQLLAAHGTEHGDHAGLGLIDGRVQRIDTSPGLRVPHVGWNAIETLSESPLFDGLSPERSFYFVHSYEFVPADPGAVSATTDYGRKLTACVERDNVFGVQFHPEKSQADGLALLRGFLDVTC